MTCLGNRALPVAAAVRRQDEHVRLVHAQERFVRVERDAVRVTPSFSTSVRVPDTLEK